MADFLWLWVAHATLPRGEQRVSKRREKSTAGAAAMLRASGDRLFFAKRGEGSALRLSARDGSRMAKTALAGLVHDSPARRARADLASAMNMGRLIRAIPAKIDV